LPPWAWAELAALQEMEHTDLCKSCRREILMATLERHCERCGKTFEDPETKAALERL